MSDLSCTKKKYDKIAYALEEVKTKGYGIVTPSIDELVLEEPEMVKQGSRFGVKLRATAPSIHMIQSMVETEIAPIVGSEQQAKDLVDYIESAAQKEQDGIWNTNIFGKSIEQIVEDGMNAKINQMTDSCQQKLQDALKKIINDSNGGIVCIII